MSQQASQPANNFPMPIIAVEGPSIRRLSDAIENRRRPKEPPVTKTIPNIPVARTQAGAGTVYHQPGTYRVKEHTTWGGPGDTASPVEAQRQMPPPPPPAPLLQPPPQIPQGSVEAPAHVQRQALLQPPPQLPQLQGFPVQAQGLIVPSQQQRPRPVPVQQGFPVAQGPHGQHPTVVQLQQGFPVAQGPPGQPPRPMPVQQQFPVAQGPPGPQRQQPMPVQQQFPVAQGPPGPPRQQHPMQQGYHVVQGRPGPQQHQQHPMPVPVQQGYPVAQGHPGPQVQQPPRPVPVQQGYPVQQAPVYQQRPPFPQPHPPVNNGLQQQQQPQIVYNMHGQPMVMTHPQPAVPQETTTVEALRITRTGHTQQPLSSDRLRMQPRQRMAYGQPAPPQAQAQPQPQGFAGYAGPVPVQYGAQQGAEIPDCSENPHTHPEQKVIERPDGTKETIVWMKPCEGRPQVEEEQPAKKPQAGVVRNGKENNRFHPLNLKRPVVAIKEEEEEVEEA